MGSAPLGWEVPCISRPTRQKNVSTGVLASVPEDLVRQAVMDSVAEEEVAGGWVEDVNGLLECNKGFKGRFVNHDEE